MDEYFMSCALKEAKKAYKKNEIPVGCVIVREDQIISKGYNMRETKKNSLMHAELIAVDRACKKIGDWRLDDCSLYVTLEPCMMCMGAIVESRIKRVFFGTKNNNEQMYVLSKNVDIVCLNNSKCSDILSDFFKNKRKK